jgi:hypothetical protein
MKFEVKNEDFEIASGTCLQGYISATFEELVAIFGEPGVGDEYKTDAEWIIEFEDGTVATIYNWKDGRNYCGEDGLAVEDITDWHVGGFGQRAVDRVEYAIESHSDSLEWRVAVPA